MPSGCVAKASSYIFDIVGVAVDIFGNTLSLTKSLITFMPSNILSIFLVKLLISFCVFCICIFFRQSKKFGSKHSDVKIMERIFITFWNAKLEWGFPLLKIDQSYIF